MNILGTHHGKGPVGGSKGFCIKQKFWKQKTKAFKLIQNENQTLSLGFSFPELFSVFYTEEAFPGKWRGTADTEKPFWNSSQFKWLRDCVVYSRTLTKTYGTKRIKLNLIYSNQPKKNTKPFVRKTLKNVVKRGATGFGFGTGIHWKFRGWSFGYSEKS